MKQLRLRWPQYVEAVNDLNAGRSGEEKTGRRWVVYAMLVGSMMLWGGTWPVGRMLAGTMNPWNAALIRFVLATIALVLISLRVNGRGALKVKAVLLPKLFLLGATGIFGYSFLFFYGLKTTDAGRASLIVGSIPVCIALCSAIIARKRPHVLAIVGILLSLTGVAVVIANGDPRVLLAGKIRPGDMMIVGCVILWTAYTLLARPVMKIISPLTAVTWSCIFGTLMILPFALFSGISQQVLRAVPADWIGLVYLGVAATALAYYWYYRAVHQIGAVASGIFINLVPLFAVLLGWGFLKEPLYISSIAGGVLVVTGVIITARRSG